MEIKITYFLKKEQETRTINLSPEEYFDPLEPGETFEENGVPTYQYTFDYIGCSANELKWSIEKISSSKGTRILRSQYLDGDRSMMEHIIDPDGSEEIIHSNQIEKDKWHIIRTYKSSNGSWSVIRNGLIDETSKAKQMSTEYEGDWSYEELKNFCEIK
jgi:hypothetical protein